MNTQSILCIIYFVYLSIRLFLHNTHYSNIQFTCSNADNLSYIYVCITLCFKNMDFFFKLFAIEYIRLNMYNKSIFQFYKNK